MTEHQIEREMRALRILLKRRLMKKKLFQKEMRRRVQIKSEILIMRNKKKS